MKAPFIWFGGKSVIAKEVWLRLGADIQNYIEPFVGSAAVLLTRPGWCRGIDWTETINDANGYVSNFWRAIHAKPEETAHYADWPVNENDLHARHAWLVGQHENMQAALEGDPDWCDPKIAGWWCWGLALWIGSKFCGGNGRWHSVDGKLIRVTNGDSGPDIWRIRPHLSDKGRRIIAAEWMGVSRRRPQLTSKGQGVCAREAPELLQWFAALSARFARVRVTCGDWSRVCTPAVMLAKWPHCAVFLDPPYGSAAGRDPEIYTFDSDQVSSDVHAWCLANGDNPRLRIALCGYDGEHDMPPCWTCLAWKAQGGYSNQGQDPSRDNPHRERIWFSPHCVRQAELFRSDALDPVLVPEGLVAPMAGGEDDAEDEGPQDDQAN